jgi:hypothetical protein
MVNGVFTPKGFDNKAQGKRSAALGIRAPTVVFTPKGFHHGWGRFM